MFSDLTKEKQDWETVISCNCNATVCRVFLQPFGTRLDVYEGRPKLIAWRDRVKKVIGEKLFDEAHEVIMKAPNLAEEMKNNMDLEMFKLNLQKMFNWVQTVYTTVDGVRKLC